MVGWIILCIDRQKTNPQLLDLTLVYTTVWTTTLGLGPGPGLVLRAKHSVTRVFSFQFSETFQTREEQQLLNPNSFIPVEKFSVSQRNEKPRVCSHYQVKTEAGVSQHCSLHRFTPVSAPHCSTAHVNCTP